MEKFLLIIREDLKRMSRLTEEERRATIPEMLKWVESLTESGNYIGGEVLTATGRYVTKNSVLSDGPFIEAKEGVSGIGIFKAENIDQAVSIAQTCPLVMQGKAVIEVRPILTLLL